MSGTLIVRDEAIWMPTGWAYDDILTYIADELESELIELARDIRQALSTMTQYVDFSHLPDKEFRALLEASERAYARFVAEGPHSFFDNSGYPILMSIFSELKAIVRTDLRIHEPLRGERARSLAIGEHSFWASPLWASDLVVENISSDIRLLDEDLSMILLASPLSITEPQGGLALLTRSQFRIMHRTSERIYARYGDGKGRTSYAPSFFNELAMHIARFHSLMSSDSRIADARLDAPQ